MRAYMSDREARASEVDAIGRASWMLPADAQWTVEELWARDAEREARAILAETEPSIDCGTFHVPLRGGCYIADDQMQAALAESLSSFVEA